MNYYEDHRLSASKLKAYLTHDPAIAYWQETNPSPSTDAMRFGTALHAMMEKQPITVSPHAEFRTNEAKAWKKANPDFLKQAEYDEVQAWQTSILNTLGGRYPYLWECWDQGEYEKEFYTETHKGKVDCIHDGIVMDWKTAADTSFDKLQRSVWNYQWALQAALYLDLAEADEFHFVVVSKVKPHPVWVLTCSPAFIEYGRKLRAKAEKIRADFLERGDEKVLNLQPPPWADKEEVDFPDEEDAEW